VAALPTVKYERWWHVSTPGTTFVDAMALLQVLYQAKKTTLNGMVDIASLRVRTQLGFDEMDSLLQKMRTMTWVECIKIEPQKGKHLRWAKRVVEEGGNDHWVLLANPAQLTLAKVYRLFMFDTLRNETLVRQVEEAIERGLQESLATYFSD
jgi:membrane protein